MKHLYDHSIVLTASCLLGSPVNYNLVFQSLSPKCDCLAQLDSFKIKYSSYMLYLIFHDAVAWKWLVFYTNFYTICCYWCELTNSCLPRKNNVALWSRIKLTCDFVRQTSLFHIPNFNLLLGIFSLSCIKLLSLWRFSKIYVTKRPS